MDSIGKQPSDTSITEGDTESKSVTEARQSTCKSSDCIQRITQKYTLTYTYPEHRCNSSVQHLTNRTSSEKLSYFHGLPERPLIGATIGQLIDQAAEHFAEREAYVFCQDNKRGTFAELKEKVDKLASGFLALGLKKGDRVGIWGPNIEEWILTQFATSKAGLILVNINPAYQVAEAHFALKKVGCKAIVAAPKYKTQDYYRMLCEIADELPDSRPGWLHSESLPDLQHVIITGDHKLKGTMTFNQVMHAGTHIELDELNTRGQHLQFDDPISIQFTSGTTGNPKGATLTHHNIINNAHLVGSILKYDQPTPTKICIPVPLYHCFGMVLGSLASLVFGATAVYPAPTFDARESLRAVHNERCTSLYGTPTMFIDMLNHEDLNKFDVTSLHAGVMAGSPCHMEVMNAAIKKLHVPDLTIAYGLTETSPVTNQTHLGDSTEIRVSTVGRMHPHVEGKVVNKEGEIVPIGEKGEFCVRGYCVMSGYWEDDEKTRNTVQQSGWLYTGDLASFDEHGNLRILGRIKDMLIRGGENIYPTEIEQFLHHHPKIQEVEVIGVPDKRMGEEICAWIRLASGETATEEEIKEFCKGKISHFKIPRYIKFVNDMPMTVTGKVKKYKMRDISIKELGLD